ncbi:MAG: hypothetical protein GX625_00165 [Clostridiaceae bacterium]|nr:hypothetical protein [Clostridiaceae bacterium]
MSFSIGNYCGYAKRYCLYCSEFYLGHCELGGHCVYEKMPYETANVYQGGKGINYEEALKEIKKQIADAGYVYDDFLDICKEALEKQIPKKPEIIEGKMWVCPNCDNNLLWLYEKYPEKKTELNKGLPFCLSCGQAIDWEVKE